jgi:hypothetical protein
MKRVGTGILMLGTLLFMWPSMMQMFNALIDVFDTILPGATNANSTFAHLYPFMILGIWVLIALYLILSPFLHRSNTGEG